jgi:hypothetical protein
MMVAALAAVGAEASSARGRVHFVFRDQPPIAHTGGFGEPTCIACHFDGDINDSAGSLTIDGLPARYEPGRRYRLTVSVAHPGLKVAGFELSARYDAGSERGRQAGTLSATDERASVTADSGSRVQYAHHLRSGTMPVPPGVGSWIVEWTAPAAPLGSVVFHVAANASDDNDSPLGDYVFARSFPVPSSEK